MHDLRNISTPLLIDMLAIYTAEYTNMLSHNVKGKFFEACALNISRLQAAINARHPRKTGAEITQPGKKVDQFPHK